MSNNFKFDLLKKGWTYQYTIEGGYKNHKSTVGRWNTHKYIVVWKDLKGDLVAVIGFISNILITFVTIKCDKNLHTVTINLANYLVEYASTPILVVAAFFLLDGIIRKFYTIGKKAKTLLDKLPDENNHRKDNLEEEKNQVDNKD